MSYGSRIPLTRLTCQRRFLHRKTWGGVGESGGWALAGGAGR